jgi:two-component system, chemotaxis family, chemotaxis protein CheY
MPKRILITDDALFMRVTLRNILTKAGYEIAAEASNGREAISAYEEHKPDAVTMDITMPEMDGIAAVKEIRKRYPSARIIMCTALGQKHLVLEAVTAGAADYVVKPFQPDRVLEAVGKLVA